MTRILLACLLVATFQQPIGTSMQGFVMEHRVRWCEGTPLPILIERQVFRGDTGDAMGGGAVQLLPGPEVSGGAEPRSPARAESGGESGLAMRT